MNKRWLSLSILVGLALVLAPPTLADFQAGVDAYDRGDYGTALKEFRPLAEQGFASAQYNLAIMYGKGQGVPEDYVLADMWLNLAAAQGIEDSAKGLEILEKKMTPAQLAEAQRLAREWKPKGSEEGFDSGRVGRSV